MKFLRSFGFSLVEVVAVMAIAGALAVGGVSMLSSGIRMNRKIASQADRTSILQKFQASLDCPITVSKLVPAQLPSFASCDQQIVNVYDHNGKVLVTNDENAPTKIGDWTARAVCRYSASLNQVLGIDVEIAKPKAGLKNPLILTKPTDFETDAIQTTKPYSWSITTPSGTTYTDSMLYPSNAWPCAAELQTAFSLPAIIPPKVCPAGQVMNGIQPSGQPFCVDPLGLAAGEPSSFTNNVCPPGTFTSYLDAFGKATCAAVGSNNGIVQAFGDLKLIGAGLNCNTLPTPKPPILAYRFGAIAYCPANYVAVGGGAICEVPSGGGHVISTVITINASVTNCCVYYTPGDPTFYPNQATVTCACVAPPCTGH